MPPLQRVQPRATPCPSPPSVITMNYPPIYTVSPSSLRRRRISAARRKMRPTQGDWILIREMAPNQLDIAQQVSQHAHDSDSSDSGHEHDERNDHYSGAWGPPARSTAQQNSMQQHDGDVFSTRGQLTALFDSRDRTSACEARSTGRMINYTISQDATRINAYKSRFAALEGRAMRKPNGARVERRAQAQNPPNARSRYEWKRPWLRRVLSHSALVHNSGQFDHNLVDGNRDILNRSSRGFLNKTSLNADRIEFS